MRRCPDCAVGVEGEWTRRPLCATTLEGTAAPSPYPAVPLRFRRRRVPRVLTLTSLAVIALSFLAQSLFRPEEQGLGAPRSVWLGVVATWLVVLVAVGKRRNLAKFIVYLVALAGGVCVYWDYLTGWDAWSLTFVVPILCAASLIGLVITVRAVRMQVGDYIVYLGLTVPLGLTPIVFLALGWVGTVIPSAICGGLSVLSIVSLLTVRGGAVRHELATRLHL
ncbi:DUF6320 domain-containing protein [Brachybacterium sp. GPGPB12]|uniref:DUF6320 domain-containing protein n=1 Tax=Brachybacterium sp. GPGPB12 TaxID=3023517 RepID=UPI0031344F67